MTEFRDEVTDAMLVFEETFVAAERVREAA